MDVEMKVERFRTKNAGDHGDDPQEPRPMKCRFDVVKDSFASVSYSQGETLVLCTVKGPAKAPTWLNASTSAVVQVSCRPASGRTDSETTWTENVCKRMLRRVVDVKKHPWSTIRVGLQGIQDGGSQTAAYFNSMMMATVLAGLPMTTVLVAVEVLFTIDGQCIVDPGEQEEWDSTGSMLLIYDASTLALKGSFTRGLVDLKSFQMGNAVCSTAARRVSAFMKMHLTDVTLQHFSWK
jgi:ribonuclease PH